MPAVAVIGGIATAAGAATGAAALIGGTITLSTVASGLAFVGGVASALGGLTGNKKLMKFGMIAGLAGAAVGGIGSMMNSAGDVASNVAGSAGSSLMGPPTELASLDSAGNLPLSDTSNALELSAVQPAAQSAADVGSQGLLASGANPASMVAETANIAPVPDVSQAANYAPVDRATGGLLQSSFAPGTSAEMAGATGGLSVGRVANDTSVFSRFSDAIRRNPEMAKLASNVVGGIGQSYMQQQQVKEQERAAADRRARINASILGQQSR